jgi:hypothetical protein
MDRETAVRAFELRRVRTGENTQAQRVSDPETTAPGTVAQRLRRQGFSGDHAD